MKNILLILLLFSFPAWAGKQPSKEDVARICTIHYSNLVNDIVGALNMGMPVDDVKGFLSGKASKQKVLLFSLIDILRTDKEEEKNNIFYALINQCVADNFNKPRKV